MSVISFNIPHLIVFRGFDGILCLLNLLPHNHPNPTTSTNTSNPNPAISIVPLQLHEGNNLNPAISIVPLQLHEGKRDEYSPMEVQRYPPRFSARHLVPKSAPPCNRCSPRHPNALSRRTHDPQLRRLWSYLLTTHMQIRTTSPI